MKKLLRKLGDLDNIIKKTATKIILCLGNKRSDWDFNFLVNAFVFVGYGFVFNYILLSLCVLHMWVTK